jgi:hypothetical protein
MAQTTLEGTIIPATIKMNTDEAIAKMNEVSNMASNMSSNMLSAGRRAVGGVAGVMAATDRLYNAQQRVNVANINYVLTIRQFGAGSIQAQRAMEQLQIATNGVNLANLRLQTRYLQFALSVGPQVYKTIMSIIAAVIAQTGANYMEATSWYVKAAAIGLTIGLLTLGIGVLAGLSAGAAVQQNISQQNQFYGMGATNPNTQAQFANTNLADIASAAMGGV